MRVSLNSGDSIYAICDVNGFHYAEQTRERKVLYKIIPHENINDSQLKRTGVNMLELNKRY